MLLIAALLSHELSPPWGRSEQPSEKYANNWFSYLHIREWGDAVHTAAVDLVNKLGQLQYFVPPETPQQHQAHCKAWILKQRNIFINLILNFRDIFHMQA